MLLKIVGNNGLHRLHHNMFDIVKAVATFAVSVASCKRAHCKLKIINNYLPASMSDDRLENLVQTCIEDDVVGILKDLVPKNV